MYLLLVRSIFLLTIAALILVPFHLCLDLKIDGFSVTGFYKVKWFGLTLRRAELSGPGGDEDRKRLEDKKKTRDGSGIWGEGWQRKGHCGQEDRSSIVSGSSRIRACS